MPLSFTQPRDKIYLVGNVVYSYRDPATSLMMLNSVNAVDYAPTPRRPDLAFPVWRRPFSYTYTIDNTIEAIDVRRMSSQQPGASTGELTSSVVYYGDVIQVIVTPKVNYYIDNPRFTFTVTENRQDSFHAVYAIRPEAPTITSYSPIGTKQSTVSVTVKFNQQNTGVNDVSVGGQLGFYLKGSFSIGYGYPEGSYDVVTSTVDTFVPYTSPYTKTFTMTKPSNKTLDMIRFTVYIENAHYTSDSVMVWPSDG